MTLIFFESLLITFLFWSYDKFLQLRNISLMPTLFKEAKMGVKLLKKRLGVTDVSFVKTVITIYWSPKHGDENLKVFSIVFFCFFCLIWFYGVICLYWLSFYLIFFIKSIFIEFWKLYFAHLLCQSLLQHRPTGNAWLVDDLTLTLLQLKVRQGEISQ